MGVSSWVGNRELCPPGAFCRFAKTAGCKYCRSLPWGDTLDPAVPFKARALHPAPSLAALSLSQSSFSDSEDSLSARLLAREEADTEWTSAAWHKQTKSDCLITCSRPFAGLARLMGKKMHCFQPRQKLDCHACPGACALHYNASSCGTRWGWRAAARAGHPTCHGVKLRQSCCLSGPSSTSHACFS